MFAKKVKSFDEKQINEKMKKLFLVEIPQDFFQLWTFCSKINPMSAKAALHDIDLLLVGPFDAIDDKIDESLAEKDPEKCLCYYRFYYDPPEFQTVLREIKSNYHIGYFRDSPDEMPSMVASNDPDKSCVIAPLGDNLFSALIAHCETLLTKKSSDKGNKRSSIEKIIKKIKSFAEENGISITNEGLRERRKKVVAKTFHGAGIVVPVKNDVGYRPLPETDQNLKKMLKKIIETGEGREESKVYQELRNIINLTNLANDECDFGMALELGIDLFCFGDEYFHKHILFLLETAYDLLGRSKFSRILKAHLDNRRKGKQIKFHLPSSSSSSSSTSLPPSASRE